MKKRVLFQIIFVALLSILSISCNYLSQPEEVPVYDTTKWKPSSIFFYYNNSLLTFEEDGKVLYSPIIKVHYTGKWTKYQLAQLDSIFDFAKRNDSCLLILSIIYMRGYSWGNEDFILNDLEKKIKKKKLPFLQVTIGSSDYLNIVDDSYLKDGYNLKVLDSIQQSDSIYYLVLDKRTCVDCKCSTDNYFKKYGPKGNRKTY